MGIKHKYLNTINGINGAGIEIKHDRDRLFYENYYNRGYKYIRFDLLDCYDDNDFIPIAEEKKELLKLIEKEKLTKSEILEIKTKILIYYLTIKEKQLIKKQLKSKGVEL